MCAMVSAVVLAAGASSRFGSPKQRLLLAPVARVVQCVDWERGPGASLRCGLGALSPEAEAAVVVLADGPMLAPEAIDRIVAAWREGAGDVVAASYGGNRGHPVVLDRGMWAQIPDEGARALEPALVPCDDLGSPGDVDVPEDLRRRVGGAGAE